MKVVLQGSIANGERIKALTIKAATLYRFLRMNSILSCLNAWKDYLEVVERARSAIDIGFFIEKDSTFNCKNTKYRRV